MAKKRKTLTTRQRQSQRIMREKNAMKIRRAIMRKVYLTGGSALCMAVLGGGFWLWKSDTAMRYVQAVVDGAYGYTVKAGFGIDSLYLEGRSRTAMSDIDKAIGVKLGDPILKLSIDEVRERLEKIESVKYAAVERALPGTLYVRIVEREPVALWQNYGRVALVDDNGVVMNDIPIAPYRHLPLIIGEKAPQHIGELMTILAAEPDLTRRFSAAIRVSDRRWNIRLTTRGSKVVEVRLPEDKPAEAWKKLSSLQANQQLLDRDVTVIDLRLEGKVFIKLAPDNVHAKTGNARET